jgi:hypothetical protein
VRAVGVRRRGMCDKVMKGDGRAERSNTVEVDTSNSVGALGLE